MGKVSLCNHFKHNHINVITSKVKYYKIIMFRFTCGKTGKDPQTPHPVIFAYVVPLCLSTRYMWDLCALPVNFFKKRLRLNDIYKETSAQWRTI